MEEIWKDIPDFPGYQVSDQGRVRSFRMIAGPKERLSDYPQKILKWCRDRNGYPQVFLRRNGKDWTKKIHKLVMETFIGPCPQSKEVCHKDDNPDNPFLANLYYGTHVDNMRDLARNFKVAGQKLSEENVREIKQRIARGDKQRTIAADFSVSPPTISDIKFGRRWDWVTIESS